MIIILNVQNDEYLKTLFKNIIKREENDRNSDKKHVSPFENKRPQLDILWTIRCKIDSSFTVYKKAVSWLLVLMTFDSSLDTVEKPQKRKGGHRSSQGLGPVTSDQFELAQPPKMVQE